MSKIQNYDKILIVRLDRIGDVLLSTPVIKAVRDAYPKSRIAMMVRPYARDVVQGNPYLDEVIVYDKSGSEKGLGANIRFIRALKKKRFDLAIILHPTRRTHLIAASAGIPVRVGYDRKCGFLLTKRIPHTKQLGLKHEIDYTLGLLSYIGMEPKDRALFMPVCADAERRIAELFKDSGIEDADLVVALNPGASCPSKRWKAENFAKVARSLIDRRGAKIVIISGKDDQVFGNKVASLIGNRCLNLTGKTSVAELASVLRRAKLFISNDSGPVHVSCAVGTPVIAIFGRSDRGLSPQRWGPSGKRDMVIRRDVGCEVCLAHECRIAFRCLEAVTTGEVLEAAERILRGVRP